MTLVGLGRHRCLLDNSAYARAGHPVLVPLLAEAAQADLIARHSALEFESRWVAEPGTL